MKITHIAALFCLLFSTGCQLSKKESLTSDTTATPAKPSAITVSTGHPKDQQIGDFILRYPDSQTVKYLHRMLAIKDSLNHDLIFVGNPIPTNGEPDPESPRYQGILHNLFRWRQHPPKGTRNWYMVDGDEVDSSKLFIVNLGTCETEGIEKREAIFFGDSIVVQADESCNIRSYFFGESQFLYQSKIGMSQAEVLERAKPDTWSNFLGKDSSSLLSAHWIVIRGRTAIFDGNHRLIGWD